MYIHTTDSHGGFKVCDSSHEAISYPALLFPFSLQVSLVSTSRQNEGMCTAVTPDKEGGLSALCWGCGWRRGFGWLGLLVATSFTVPLFQWLFQWELRHRHGSG